MILKSAGSSIVVDEFERLNLGPIKSISQVQGGSICDSYKITTQTEQPFFIKTRESAPDDFFIQEAFSLNTLLKSNTVRTPKPIWVSKTVLVLEWIEPEPLSNGSWCQLGREVAQMHTQPLCPYFGFSSDNYCGISRQQNKKMKDGFEFFAQNRLLPQAKWAFDAHYLELHELRKIEFIADHLSDWIPLQPPCLLHGDLWAGNILGQKNIGGVLIDPACYYGWAEADIAMSCLLSTFPESFYQGYDQINAFEPDFEARIPLYNLYHLLNHLNIFGQSYWPHVDEILKRYA